MLAEKTSRGVLARSRASDRMPAVRDVHRQIGGDGISALLVCGRQPAAAGERKSHGDLLASGRVRVRVSRTRYGPWRCRALEPMNASSQESAQEGKGAKTPI